MSLFYDKTRSDGLGVSTKSFRLCKSGDVVDIILKRLRTHLYELAFFQKVVDAERRRKSRRAACGERVVAARHIIADGFRSVVPEED